MDPQLGASFETLQRLQQRLRAQIAVVEKRIVQGRAALAQLLEYAGIALPGRVLFLAEVLVGSHICVEFAQGRSNIMAATAEQATRQFQRL